ncbi:MAG: acyltransferase [Oscillospiraceae bacterium]|nr:acyltransferase [Oscillospiraceae bacterium]
MQQHKNNFNFIRLLGAILVMTGHMGVILGGPVPSLGSQSLHQIGVEILFIMGGYLIASSWIKDPHPGRFFLKRFLRLYPPFAVMILLLCFIGGPILSELGVRGYYGSWWKPWLNNLRFYPVFAQPGVFLNNPLPLVSNGSIWTMPVEAFAYLMTPVLLFFCRKCGQKSFFPLGFFTALFFAADLFLIWKGNPVFLFYGTDWVSAFHLLVYFVIGMSCSMESVKTRFHLQLCPIFLFFILLTPEFGSAWFQQAVWLCSLPYIVFSVALADEPVFWKLGRKTDLSYGIFLYGFFFQQLVEQWNITYSLAWNYMSCLAASMLLTVLTAWLNCVLIENPVLRLSRKLTSITRDDKNDRQMTDADK